MWPREIHIPLWTVRTILVSYPYHIFLLPSGLGVRLVYSQMGFSHTVYTLFLSRSPRWLAVDKGDGQTSVRINAVPHHTGNPTSHLSPSSLLPLPSLTVSSADDSTVNGRTKTLAGSNQRKNMNSIVVTGTCAGGTTGCPPQLPPSFPLLQKKLVMVVVFMRVMTLNLIAISLSPPQEPIHNRCAHPSVCFFKSVCQIVCMYLLMCLQSVCLSVHLCTRLLVCLPLCLSVFQFVNMPACQSVTMSVYLPVCQSNP